VKAIAETAAVARAALSLFLRVIAVSLGGVVLAGPMLGAGERPR
jgi:hypothetical protein